MLNLIQRDIFCMAKISHIIAREILDSRATPTVEVQLTTNDGTIVTASCPSGASVSAYEAVELRDNNNNRYNGKGVLNAVDNVNNIIAPKLKDHEVTDQKKIDQTMIELDATENKSQLGANAILPVSMAVAKTAAVSNAI